MDIVSPKKSNLLYQSGDQKTRGVVDLRAFAKGAPRTPCPRRGQVFSEIKPVGRKIAATAPEPTSDIRSHAKAVSGVEMERSGNLLPVIFRQEAASIQSAPETIATEGVPAARAVRPNRLSLPRFSRPELSPRWQLPALRPRRAFARFAISSCLVPVIIFSFAFAQGQFEKKGKVLGESTLAYDSLKSAAAFALSSDFGATSENFDSATLNFSQARDTINSLGFGVGEVIANLPVDTPLSTAQNLASAGENISLTGKDLSELMEKVSNQSENGLGSFTGLEENLRSASGHLSAASDNLKKVDTRYLPENLRAKIELAQQTLPTIAANFSRLSADYPLLMKMLGQNQPQKYLLLFENNSEMRATGGFIGSYGILDIKSGKIENLAIDGIFNPDGQLKEKIVPPMPIQKISASWSMHDSNWFADFPTSAKKTALLYEKTGGPTVDGVIAITPETIKKLLEVTGPIEMPAYGVTITAENFVAETQNQVENLYDKKENKPKKILSDLAPLVLEKLLHDDTLTPEAKAERLLGAVEKIEESLKEKHILIYHRDENVEAMLQKRGWAGEIIQNASGDYLSVVNSNINGYKTDAMIEETIDLDTAIGEDGTVINTLTIKRKHTGGNENYDWYNRVNADYLRVYVPRGSVLLQATGNTVETYAPPMDYAAFKTDPDVAAVEGTLKLDPESGTQVFEESGKTVFGNWVYVSPQEEVTVTYRYQLPFRVDFASGSGTVDAYSAIIQKQSGSTGSAFTARLHLPEKWQTAWSTSNLRSDRSVSEQLRRDLIYGAVLLRN